MISSIGIVSLVSIIEAVSLTLLRIEDKNSVVFRLIIASSIYAFAVVPLLFKTLEYQGIGMVNFLWNILSTILMFGIGIFIFKEKVESLQVIGLLISFLGIGLILLSEQTK